MLRQIAAQLANAALMAMLQTTMHQQATQAAEAQQFMRHMQGQVGATELWISNIGNIVNKSMEQLDKRIQKCENGANFMMEIMR